MRLSIRDCSLALVIIALLGPSVGSAACDTSRDRAGAKSPRATTASMGSHLAGIFEANSLARGNFVLDLPDLTPDKYKYFVNGNSVEVYIDVRNNGRVDSRATSALVTLEIWDPARAVQYGNDLEVTAALPVITPGMTTRVYLTTVYLPNVIEDFDVLAAGFVDPSTSPQAPQGSVFESNEMNNAKMHACRVFGADPVLIPTPPPVCN